MDEESFEIPDQGDSLLMNITIENNKENLLHKRKKSRSKKKSKSNKKAKTEKHIKRKRRKKSSKIARSKRKKEKIPDQQGVSREKECIDTEMFNDFWQKENMKIKFHYSKEKDHEGSHMFKRSKTHESELLFKENS